MTSIRGDCSDTELYRYLMNELNEWRCQHYDRIMPLYWVMSDEWKYACWKLTHGTGIPVMKPGVTPYGPNLLLGIPVIVSEDYALPRLTRDPGTGKNPLVIRKLSHAEMAQR